MLEKILVPIDGSETSLRALNFAMQLGKQFKSEIIALQIEIPYSRSSLDKAMDKVGSSHKPPEIEKNISPIKLAEMRATDAEYANIRFKKLIDINPAERIDQAILDEKANLVVMGNRGLGMLGGLLMGSVSSKVVKTAACPVVIVK